MIRDAGRYDAVVIGAGVAGLTAAAHLAQRGASVCVLARGVGCTHLAPATIDVLADGDLATFVNAHPEHPYAGVGVDGVAAALDWLRNCFDDGYRYVGELGTNHVLPGPLGAVRHSALVPVTMAAGALGDAAPICVVGLPALRDFPAGLCAANLAARGHEARAVSVDLDDRGRAETNAVTLARRFDEPAFRADFAVRLRPLLRDDERVGMPAVLGLRDPHSAWTDLQERLEHPVFEVPTLPPSAPGVRLFNALRDALRAARGTLTMGAHVIPTTRAGAVRARVSGHDRDYESRAIVLATGGLASGGIELTAAGDLRETALGLDVAGEVRVEPDAFVARVGVTTGRDDVYVAGAALPGADARRDGCGEGVALSTGHRVAGLIAA